jgi:hypothetical protein
VGSPHFLRGFPSSPSSIQWSPRSYAEQIARDWNKRDAKSGFVGHVLQFQVRTDYLEKFPVQKAGAREHLEYWIPAEQMSQFNQNIVGKIEVIAEYRERDTNP